VIISTDIILIYSVIFIVVFLCFNSCVPSTDIISLAPWELQEMFCFVFVQPLYISPLPAVQLTQIQFAVIFILPRNQSHTYTIKCLLLIMLTCRKGRSEWLVGFITTHCSYVTNMYSDVTVYSIQL